MKGLFIVNPSSGRQNFQQKLKDIMGTLIYEQICSTIDVYFTEKQDDAMQKAASLKPGEYDFVVSVGGDGTLNEVINGIMIGRSEIPVAVISFGTVNDFATYLQLPQDTKHFCDIIRHLRVKKVDVGKANDKYFINVVAAGLLTDIGYKVPKDKKAAMGKMAYYMEGAMDLPKKFNKAFKLRFELGDGMIEEEVLLFIVANSQSVGGFREIAPMASTTDGVFDLIIIKTMDILQVTPLLLSILSGDHVNHPCVEYHQIKKLQVMNLSDELITVDYDGEKLEDDWPLNVEVIPAGINIVVSDKNKWNYSIGEYND